MCGAHFCYYHRSALEAVLLKRSVPSFSLIFHQIVDSVLMSLNVKNSEGNLTHCHFHTKKTQDVYMFQNVQKSLKNRGKLTALTVSAEVVVGSFSRDPRVRTVSTMRSCRISNTNRHQNGVQHHFSRTDSSNHGPHVCFLFKKSCLVT